MTGSRIDGSIDQLVKARWLTIGISQTDLADVLSAALSHPTDDGLHDGDSSGPPQLAEVSNLPANLDESLEQGFVTLQALQELRLLRAFHELQDNRTKWMLINLAERIVKRQANRHSISR